MKENASKKNGAPSSLQPDLKGGEPPKGKSISTPKPEARVGKRIARWMLWLIIVFGLGATAMAVFFYFPLQKEQKAIEANLVTSGQKISADRQKIESLTAQKTELEEKNKDLQSQLDRANLRLAVIKAKSDIMAASLAVSDGDVVSARLSLEKATMDLQTLSSLLKDGSLGEVLTTIQGHLEQVKSELNDKFQTDQPDLDTLIDNLSSLEDALNN
jgi:cell division protein FtsB